MMIDLDAIDALVEDRAASVERRVVIEHPVNDRIGDADLVEDVAADRTPHILRNDVAGERVAYHGGAHLTRRARVVELAEDHGATQRVGPDLRARTRVSRERRV